MIKTMKPHAEMIEGAEGGGSLHEGAQGRALGSEERRTESIQEASAKNNKNERPLKPRFDRGVFAPAVGLHHRTNLSKRA